MYYHMKKLYQNLLDEYIINVNESIFWEETGGCEKNICALEFYLTEKLSLTLMIITDR